ncbi:HD domain-containing protein [Haloglycomyces albus]|uniref:HD domain-containing protein n=1 Tax=Haloglycomyces albus TaxID=526067 RepID=UPI00046C8DB0|nr:HD domain-containing protein [Haloglycomyces albus]
MDHYDGIANLMFEMGNLKRIKRTGWWIAGIKDPESIAEYSHRVSLLGTILAALEGADPARTCLLGTLHDIPETRIGDIPHIGRAYLSAKSAESIAADQVADCPDEVNYTIKDAIDEFEAASTSEAKCAKDADKLECLIQAVEYQKTGATTVGPWIDNSLKALKTDSAHHIAHAVINGESLAWQQSRSKE